MAINGWIENKKAQIRDLGFAYRGIDRASPMITAIPGWGYWVVASVHWIAIIGLLKSSYHATKVGGLLEKS